MTTQPDTTELRALAQAFKVEPPHYLDDEWEYDGGPDGDGIVWTKHQFMGDPVAASAHPEVAEWIAAANPTRILALLDENTTLRHQLAEVRRIHGSNMLGRCQECGAEFPCRTLAAALDQPTTQDQP